MTELAPEPVAQNAKKDPSLSSNVLRNTLPRNEQTVLGIIATNQGSIDYCDGCIEDRSPLVLGRNMCAREALLPSLEQNAAFAAATLRACVQCAETTRSDKGAMPGHGIVTQHVLDRLGEGLH